ncbi:MAG: hypothetical protein FWC12_11010 [Treponema sp.]|nr:hypothetical protein [Treponema sp.]
MNKNLLILISILLFTLSACETGEQDSITVFGPPLNAKTSSSTNTGIPRVLDSYTDGKNNYFLLDVGYISDMYISTLAAIDYTGVPIDFVKTISTSETYTNSLTKTISESMTISRTDSTTIGVGLEWKNKVGIGIIGSEFTAKSNFEWTWTGENSSTTTKSTTNTATTVSQYAESQTINYKFGTNTNPRGMYRYAVYGICDVYFKIIISISNQELIGWETFVCARPNDYFLRSEYSENRVFDNKSINTIDIDENFYKSLPIPTQSPVELTETEFKSIRTSTVKITDSGRFDQHFDVVSFDKFNINLDKMKQEGLKTINFNIRLNVREIDDGYRHIFLFSSASQSNDFKIAECQFEHSPGKKDTSWWVHYEDELKFSNISINNFLNNQFIIRYGASGKNNDTWENKDLQIQLVFKK